jgi:hypothetical protein
LDLKPGTRLRSAVSQVELVVIRAPGSDVDLRCGAIAMIDSQEDAVPQNASARLEGTVELGKRYIDGDDTLELLCTKGGQGTLTLGSQPLVIKGAKPLPSSD